MSDRPSRSRPDRSPSWASWTLVLVIVVAVAAACDSRPRGPGSYTVSVEWDEAADPLGAALLFLGSPELGDIHSQDGTMVWGNTPPGEEGGMRVLVIHTGTPSTLRFNVDVGDLGAGPPRVTILSLTAQSNQAILPSESYRTRVIRTR